MNRIVEFYESYHFYVLALVIIATLIIIIGKNRQIKELLSKVDELKVKLSKSKVRIAEEEIIRIEKIIKSIKVGSLVKLKYVLTGEIITIVISEYQSGLIENQSEIKRINSKMPLAVALLNKEVGDIVKFKLNKSDEKEVYLEVLNVGVENKQATKEVVVEEEIINNELDPIMDLQKKVVITTTSSKDMSEGFKRWLSRGNNNKGNNYAFGTVIGYSNAINKLSAHYSKNETRVNIYNLNGQSIDKLKIIEQLYSLDGRYYDYGNKAHGTYRNAMVAYVRFIESLNLN